MYKLCKDLYKNYNQIFDISRLSSKNEIKAILIGKGELEKLLF